MPLSYMALSGEVSAMKNKKSIKSFLFIVLLFVVLIYGFIFAEKIVKPAIFSIAEIRVKEIVIQIVNDAVHTEFSGDFNFNDFITTKTGQDGKVVMVQANSAVMNRLSSELALLIERNFQEIISSHVRISVGSIVGSQLLSQYGPMIKLNVMPIGMAKVNFKTEFESAGINQTRHKIYLEVDTQTKIVIPFSMRTIDIKTMVPIAETIIVGDVPQSFIFMPEDEKGNLIPSQDAVQ